MMLAKGRRIRKFDTAFCYDYSEAGLHMFLKRFRTRGKNFGSSEELPIRVAQTREVPSIILVT